MTEKKDKLTSLSPDIDALLQDTYLLVVELQHNAATREGAELWRHCVTLVERCRESLINSGVSQRAVDLIGYAHCALLDETVMCNATSQAHAIWVATPLQAHFFNRHQAGVQLYEDMREALATPVPDRLVLTCYHRVLMLGFLGRYREEGAPEREHLFIALSEHVKPFATTVEAPLLVRPGGDGWRHWFGKPWLHVTIAVLLLAGLWLTLYQVLVETIASSSTGQV